MSDPCLASADAPRGSRCRVNATRPATGWRESPRRRRRWSCRAQTAGRGFAAGESSRPLACEVGRKAAGCALRRRCAGARPPAVPAGPIRAAAHWRATSVRRPRQCNAPARPPRRVFQRRARPRSAGGSWCVARARSRAASAHCRDRWWDRARPREPARPNRACSSRRCSIRLPHSRRPRGAALQNAVLGNPATLRAR